jgi:hypothetical protein
MDALQSSPPEHKNSGNGRTRAWIMGDGTDLGRCDVPGTELPLLYLTGHYRDKDHKHETIRLRTVDSVPFLALFKLHRRSDDEV